MKSKPSPGHDWQAIQQEQLRESQLDRLLSGRQHNAGQTATGIELFLARWGGRSNPIDNAQGKYLMLVDSVLDLKATNDIAQTKHLIEQAAALRRWLHVDREGYTLTAAEQIFKRSLAAPHWRGDWACKIMEAYEFVGSASCLDVAWVDSLSPSPDQDKRQTWDEAIGGIIKLHLRKAFLSQQIGQEVEVAGKLHTAAHVWDVSGRTWQTDEEGIDRLIQIETKITGLSELSQEFLSFQKQRQLQAVAVKLRGDEITDPTGARKNSPKM